MTKFLSDFNLILTARVRRNGVPDGFGYRCPRQAIDHPLGADVIRLPAHSEKFGDPAGASVPTGVVEARAVSADLIEGLIVGVCG